MNRDELLNDYVLQYQLNEIKEYENGTGERGRAIYAYQQLLDSGKPPTMIAEMAHVSLSTIARLYE